MPARKKRSATVWLIESFGWKMSARVHLGVDQEVRVLETRARIVLDVVAVRSDPRFAPRQPAELPVASTERNGVRFAAPCNRRGSAAGDKSSDTSCCRAARHSRAFRACTAGETPPTAGCGSRPPRPGCSTGRGFSRAVRGRTAPYRRCRAVVFAACTTHRSESSLRAPVPVISPSLSGSVSCPRPVHVRDTCMSSLSDPRRGPMTCTVSEV